MHACWPACPTKACTEVIGLSVRQLYSLVSRSGNQLGPGLKSRDERRPEDLGIWKGKGFASLYLDDALTRALESNAEHRLQVLTFLRICTIERIPLGAAKAEIFCKFVRFLGMINGNGLLAPCPNKVVAIVQLERPWDLNTLQQFLGAVNWFRRHISDHNGVNYYRFQYSSLM
jgi:hypothetical protein